ncbi:hypothetical protein CUMW_030690 [Citrus unshiu]|nr:hypothetical protein CUMW_030690 [Citrus unshiu]
MAKRNPPTTCKRSSELWVPECSGFLLGCLLAFALQIFFFSSPVSSATFVPTNSSFKGMIKLGEGIVNHPEDVSVDGNGVLYTATGDGWIKRMHPNGTWEDWHQVGSQSLLGLTTTKENNVIIVCDSQQGLLKVSEEGVTVLVSQFNGSQLRFANDVIEASDGSLYFTVSSTKFTPAEYYLDLVSGEPHGVLLKYDPSTNQTSLVLDGLYFANGVALSEDERFLVVCESWKFRCVKHFLKVSGRTDREIFIDNLPGGPDNVNLARDGSFWISIIKMDPKGIQALQSCKERKQLLEAYPELIKLLIPLGKQAAAAVVNVKADGRLNREISDPNATDISFVTSAQGHDNNLYLASINSDFIGKLPLRPL